MSAHVQFFGMLPKDRLTPGEEKLRKLLHEAAAAASAVLPLDGKIPLQSWVDRRMPGELLLHCDMEGRVVLAPLKTDSRPVHSPPPDRSRKAKSPPPDKSRRFNSDEDFFATLPPDGFNNEEKHLRARLIAMLESGTQDFTHLLKDSDIQMRKRKLLPEHILLENWIESRIGEEIKVIRGKGGKVMCRLVNAPAPQAEQRDDRAQIVEDFFESLPGDNFTHSENALRDALLHYIRTTDRPILSVALTGDDQVKRAKVGMRFPNGVSTKTWIERRIGQEIGLDQQANGQFMMVLKAGLVDHESLQRRHEPANKGKSKGKGHDDGKGKGSGKEMKPGDWLCPNCGDHQFRSNTECRRCGEPHPFPERVVQKEMKPGDWLCPRCGDHQYTKNTECRKCGEPKPKGAGKESPEAFDAFARGRKRGAEEMAPQGGKGKGKEMEPGDWLCPKCSFHNFRRNTECKKCGTPNPNGGY